MSQSTISRRLQTFLADERHCRAALVVIPTLPFHSIPIPFAFVHTVFSVPGVVWVSPVPGVVVPGCAIRPEEGGWRITYCLVSVSAQPTLPDIDPEHELVLLLRVDGDQVRLEQHRRGDCDVQLRPSGSDIQPSPSPNFSSQENIYNICLQSLPSPAPDNLKNRLSDNIVLRLGSDNTVGHIFGLPRGAAAERPRLEGEGMGLRTG